MTVNELLDKYRNTKSNIPALAKLSEVNWSALKHAHGEASDFPILIHAALSDDENDREFALKLLHETIWHQGSIYQATAFAVPFIAELIKSPDITNQADFAGLLASIAQGYGDFEEGFNNKKDELHWKQIFARQGIDLDDVVSESTKWAQATRSNVRKYLSLLYPYINYSDGLNVWIARALSCYPEVRHETIPLIEDAIEIEKNEDVKKWLGESLNKLMS
jgi:hypothetical protein